MYYSKIFLVNIYFSYVALNLICEKLPDRISLYMRQFRKIMIMIIVLVLTIYGIEFVEVIRGKYWEMGYFKISMQGIEFKENYMPKKYAVAILALATFLMTIGATIDFLKIDNSFKYNFFVY